MMKKLPPRKCFSCGNIMREWFVKNERLFLRCADCQLVMVAQGVANSEQGVSLYEDDNNIFLKDGNENYYFDDSNLLSCREKLEWVKNYVPAKSRLLDAGANLGHFLKTAQNIYHASGFELSPMAVEWSIENFGVSNQVASIYELPDNIKGPYDVITCWDVIEHLPDPVAALDKLFDILKPGGFLFLSTPDTGSLSARLLKQKWYYLDPLQNITLFNRKNLKKTLNTTGFEVLKFGYFGHHYKIRYVFDRLLYLNQKGLIKSGVSTLKKLFFFAMDGTVYLKFFDVMGVVAQKTE